MQRKTWIIIAIIVGLAQLSIPLYMIWNKEQTIRKGNSFLFKIVPIDPTHPLKGKYIILNYPTLNVISNSEISQNKPVYAILNKKDNQEFQIHSLSNIMPSHTSDFVKVDINIWVLEENQKDSISYNINFPFTEFYMEESKAPRAEEIYRTLNQDTSQTAYAVVSIYKGDAVVTDVVINGKSIVNISGQ